MNTQELHRAQFLILRSLRHAPSARYTELRKPTGMDSDVFKFHIRKLVHQQYVRKLDSGVYELTTSGKEFANNLSKSDLSTKKQPKLSVAIVAKRYHNGSTEYLMQQRLRNPFFGFWGCITSPVLWGESLEAAAKRELKKQTGLLAEIEVKSFYRKTDYSVEPEELLEDKLFAVVMAESLRGNLTGAYARGNNAWMALDHLRVQDRYFASTFDFVDMIATCMPYQSKPARYSQIEY